MSLDEIKGAVNTNQQNATATSSPRDKTSPYFRGTKKRETASSQKVATDLMLINSLKLILILLR